MDKLCWKPSSQYLVGFFKFDFTIKSCYRLLMSFPWKSVENNNANKGQFFHMDSGVGLDFLFQKHIRSGPNGLKWTKWIKVGPEWIKVD